MYTVITLHLENKRSNERHLPRPETTDALSALRYKLDLAQMVFELGSKKKFTYRSSERDKDSLPSDIFAEPQRKKWGPIDWLTLL